MKHYAKDYPKLMPLGLAYIAAVLRGKHEISVLDDNLEEPSNEQVAELIRKTGPDVIAYSAMSVLFERAVEIARLAKQAKPSVVNVIGGPHANSLPEKVLEEQAFDYAVYGEGEITFAELLGKIERGESVEDVKGVVWRRGDSIMINPRRELIQDLDSLPFPARDLFPIEKYERREISLGVYPIDNLNTSRGCPYRCKFCSAKAILGKGYRLRSAKNVVDEIDVMVREYGSKGIYFREDNFTASRKRVEEVCDELKRRNIDVVWACESRVNSLDKELMRKMHDAGCRIVWVGAESGLQETLDRIQKDITLEQVRNVVKWGKEIGVMIGCSFIIGFPWEDKAMMDKTVDFACELDPDSAWFNIFWLMPVSEMYYEVMEAKQIDEELGSGVYTVKTGNFNREWMENYQHEAHKKFYSNPKRLMRTGFRKVRSGEISPVNAVKKLWNMFFK
ncbi:MAG: radical SAM protein [Candidatus Micrarchaeota archaeon]